VRTSTLKLYACWIQRFDAFLQGKPFLQAGSADVSSFLGSLREAGRTAGTLSQAASDIRTFFFWLYGDDEPPRSFLRSFRVLGDPGQGDVIPVPEDEMDLLLQNCRDLQQKAIVAVLRDTGFRVSELIALNVASVTMDAKGGAWVSLPKDAPDLKTGPRDVYVAKSVPFLRATLLAHPMKLDPQAPLFFSPAARTAYRRLDGVQIAVWIRRAAARAKIPHVWAHRLRHSRVTEAALKGWNEAQMRKYFGWGKTSRMPSHYTHLARSHIEDLISKEAGIGRPGLAGPQTGHVKDDSTILQALIASQAAMLELLRRSSSPQTQ